MMKKRILIPLLAGLTLLWACKGKPGYEPINNSNAGVAGLADTDTIAENPKLIKTADIRFKVKNVHQTSEQLSKLTTSFDGMVIHQRMAAVPERSFDIKISSDSVMRVSAFNTTAEMTVKIPSIRLEDFMNQVSSLGLYVNSRGMDITDQTLAYRSAQMKLRSRKELVSQQKRGRIIVHKAEDVLNLKDEMVDRQIEKMSIDDAVKNSVLTLSFYQSDTIYKEMIANPDPSAYKLRVFSRLTAAAANGCSLFVDLIVSLTNLWAFILAGIGLWFLVSYLREKRLPAKGN